ncbi:MAG TPA: response regulator [Spirochaetia bacterium]|nr:response regulator [Spirochaetia bacterium]
MWKVLIADDEPKIRRGLRTTIERLRPDMKVVAEAEDGEMALESARRERPDILMIDVRMPFLSGLQLIEKLGDVLTDSVIIVVSGHDEFEYAQRALQLKVFDYVLKPVPPEALSAVLSRAEDTLLATRRQKQYLAWAHDQLERNLPLLREQFLRDWVHGRLSPEEIAEQEQFLGVQTVHPAAMALVHAVEHAVPAAPSSERERRLALYAVRSVVEEVLAPFGPLRVFSDDVNTIVILAARAGGKEWVEAVAQIEPRVVPSLCQAVIVAETTIAEAPMAVPEAYEALSTEAASRGSHRSFVAQAQRYIDSHYGEPTLSLEQVALSSHISPGYLSRLLKLETGFSFVDYLTRVRINKAMQMMSDPAMKIYEVAEAVGYQSQHYFSRAFKRVFGRPPVEFRRGGT